MPTSPRILILYSSPNHFCFSSPFFLPSSFFLLLKDITDAIAIFETVGKELKLRIGNGFVDGRASGERLAVESLGSGDLFSSDNITYGFGPQLRWNIFNGKRPKHHGHHGISCNFHWSAPPA